MQTTDTSKERLLKYSAMASTFLAGGVVTGQVQYNDINPDAVITKTNSPYLLDFNNDLTDDLQFVVNSAVGSFTYYGFTINYSGSYAGVQAATGGGVMGAGTTYPAASALSSGNMINPAANFVQGGQLGLVATYSIVGMPSYGGPFTSGNFPGAGDKFLGVQFDVSGSQHLGWVRLELSADGKTLTIKDYAYLLWPGGEIAAGQTVGLQDVAVEDKVTFKVMPEEVTVNVTPDLIGGTLSLVDMNGREVAGTTITDINTKFTFDDAETGVYMLVAGFEKGSVSKKVYVK